MIVHGSHVLYTNPAFTQMFGYTADEASGGDLGELITALRTHRQAAMLQVAGGGAVPGYGDHGDGAEAD